MKTIPPLPELPRGLSRTATLVERLRGTYTISVDPAVGPLDGKMTHTRQFEPTPINLEAAAEIENLRVALTRLRDEPALWRRGGAGGQDQYAGMPSGMRLIDTALAGLSASVP